MYTGLSWTPSPRYPAEAKPNLFHPTATHIVYTLQRILPLLYSLHVATVYRTFIVKQYSSKVVFVLFSRQVTYFKVIWQIYPQFFFLFKSI